MLVQCNIIKGLGQKIGDAVITRTGQPYLPSDWHPNIVHDTVVMNGMCAYSMALLCCKERCVVEPGQGPFGRERA